MIFLITILIRITYQSASKRNHLTFRIHIWFILCQVVLQMKFFIQMILIMGQSKDVVAFARYCLTAI